MTHSLIVDQEKRNDANGDIIAPYMFDDDAKGSRHLSSAIRQSYKPAGIRRCAAPAA